VTLSVSNRRMTDESEGIWKEVAVAWSGTSMIFSQVKLREKRGNCQDTWSPGRDSNKEPAEYKSVPVSQYQPAWCWDKSSYSRIIGIYTVVRRTTAKKRPQKKQLYNSRCYVAASQTSMFLFFYGNNYTSIMERCFLCDPLRNVIMRIVNVSWFVLHASHAALPLVMSKFRPNVALPMLVQMSP
jgi:hypothetical protein